MNHPASAVVPRPAVYAAGRPWGFQRQVSLCEVLDRVLNKGAVVTGEVVISVAGIDLLYVGLNVLVSSIETMRRQPGRPSPSAPRLPKEQSW